MRYVIQVVDRASLEIDSKVYASISKGQVCLVSFKEGDNEKIVDQMIDKLLKLRIFPDENNKTNLSIDKFDGEILAVSQFTLYGSLKGSNRPSFTRCLNIEAASKLFDYFCNKLKEKYPKTVFGVFQADMKIDLVNNGPFTIFLDSEELNYV